MYNALRNNTDAAEGSIFKETKIKKFFKPYSNDRISIKDTINLH
jgi:hypothetical protein